MTDINSTNSSPERPKVPALNLGKFEKNLLQQVREVESVEQEVVKIGQDKIEADFISEMVNKTFSVYDADHDNYLSLDEFSLFLNDVMESHVT